MTKINIDSFMDFCKGYEGETLLTIGKRRRFAVVSVDDLKIVYEPESSKKPRNSRRKWIEKVLDHYATTGSFRPGDYRDSFLYTMDSAPYQAL